MWLSKRTDRKIEGYAPGTRGKAGRFKRHAQTPRQEFVMKTLFRCVLLVSFAVGVTKPSQAIIPFIINKIVECPPVARARAKCRAKHEAHKMKAKKPLFGG